MPQDKDFKRLIRSRMAATGERLTQARRALEGRDIDPSLTWVGRLADVEQSDRAYAHLESLPEEQRRRAALHGLTHENAKVRRRCARLLDNLSITDESVAALRKRLTDPDPHVRWAALHTLVCGHCKPDGCTVPVREIAEPMLGDPHQRVRAQALAVIGKDCDDQSIALVERFAQSDPSARVRREAGYTLAAQRLRRESVEILASLPEALRAKVERHRGKWVGVADGGIFSAAHDANLGQLRRDARGKGLREFQICWVPE